MAAAGLWTTPTDLAKFLLEIARARRGESAVLSKALALDMTTLQKPGYGLGLSLDGFGKMASFGHGGSNEGFKCQMTAYLDGGRGAVIMTNGDLGLFVAGEILRAVALAYDWPSLKPVEKKVVAVDPKALASLEGRYELRPGRFLDVKLEGGTLYVIDGEDRIELYPEIRDALLRDGRGAHPVLRQRPRRPADPHHDRRPAQSAAPLSFEAPAARARRRRRVRKKAPPIPRRPRRRPEGTRPTG